MRWKEIISEKLTQALPLRARPDAGIKKAAPLIPANPPVDPLASIVQQVAPMMGQAAHQAVALDDQEEEQVIANMLAQKQQESFKDKDAARQEIKRKYSTK